MKESKDKVSKVLLSKEKRYWGSYLGNLKDKDDHIYSSCLFSHISLSQIFPLELLLSKTRRVLRISYLHYLRFCDLLFYPNLLLFDYLLCLYCLLLNFPFFYFCIFCFTVDFFYALDKLIHIDLIIPILIDFLNHFLELSLHLWINLTAKDHPDLLSTDLTIFIPIEQIESLPKSILLLLLLLFESKCNKLAEL